MNFIKDGFVSLSSVFSKFEHFLIHYSDISKTFEFNLDF